MALGENRNDQSARGGIQCSGTLIINNVAQAKRDTVRQTIKTMDMGRTGKGIQWKTGKIERERIKEYMNSLTLGQRKAYGMVEEKSKGQ